MSRTDNPAGSQLTARHMRTIMPCFGNFSMMSVDATHDGGALIQHVFEPPYRLKNGKTYAIYQNPEGEIELWEVESPAKGVWHWVKQASRGAAAEMVLH